jgi:glycosyltransferase involved in cell wall biosynthesis
VKILVHSNAPWTPSGYGKQARYAGQVLESLGHRVSYSAFQGLAGAPIRFGKSGVYPQGVIPFGPDVIVPHARLAEAGLIVSIMDTFKLLPAADELKSCGIPFVPLVITDCMAANGGPSMPDQALIARSGALPAAVSQFGVEALIGHGPEGWEAPYVPHAVDTAIFRPPADRQALRLENGTSDQFIIGIAGANRDIMRKGYAEQFAAFARFQARHKDARLAVFSVIDSPGGIPLAEMAHDLGIIENCMFMPSFEQNAGILDDDFMADWYGNLDVLSMCSYGEGFGVPLIEAQACGTPVVATNWSAMAELARPAGWLVQGDRYWNAAHRAWWSRPDEDDIVWAWEQAYQEHGDTMRRDRAVAFASQYSLEETRKRWVDLIGDVQDWQDVKGTST